MGNCAFRGNPETSGGHGRPSEIVRVATCNGGVMELRPPITAECITNGFPGHAVYRACDVFARPLMHSEELAAGELYYLRPINGAPMLAAANVAAPYRVSFDHHGFWRKQEGLEVERRSSGVWKVKLVISPGQLAEILSQESRTEELIESVRTVAKCGNGSASASGSTSVGSSDQWSLASSRKAASESLG